MTVNMVWIDKNWKSKGIAHNIDEGFEEVEQVEKEVV